LSATLAVIVGDVDGDAEEISGDATAGDAGVACEQPANSMAIIATHAVPVHLEITDMSARVWT
jgi:hypothetical protein